MQKIAVLTMVLSLNFSSAAMAGETEERQRAVQICRTAIAEEAGRPAAEYAVKFQESKTKPRSFVLRFNVQDAKAGDVWTATCQVDRYALAVTLLSRDGAPLKLANGATN